MNSNKNYKKLDELKPAISMPNQKSHHIIKITDFLPQQDRDTLFNIVCTNQEIFQNIGNSEFNNKESLLLSLESKNPKVLEIQKTCEFLSKRIMALLPKLFITFDIKPFPVSQIFFSIINGFNGHKGVPHNDESGGRFKISILYYLNRVPKSFKGGALEFYEANATLPSGHSENAFAKIEHEDNLLVAFPSQIYHGVTEVQLESQDFEDGRLVVVGFLGPK